MAVLSALVVFASLLPLGAFGATVIAIAILLASTVGESVGQRVMLFLDLRNSGL
jgi:hypothetical protein